MIYVLEYMLMKNKKDKVLKEEPRICNLSNFTFLSNLYFLDWTSKQRRFSIAFVSCCLRLYSLNYCMIITDSQLRCLSFLISTREGTRGSSWEDCFAFFLLSREPLLAMKIQRIFWNGFQKYPPFLWSFWLSNSLLLEREMIDPLTLSIENIEEWALSLSKCELLPEGHIKVICDKVHYFPISCYLGKRTIYSRRKYTTCYFACYYLWWLTWSILWFNWIIQYWRENSRYKLFVYGWLCRSWLSFCMIMYLLLFIDWNSYITCFIETSLS